MAFFRGGGLMEDTRQLRKYTQFHGSNLNGMLFNTGGCVLQICVHIKFSTRFI